MLANHEFSEIESRQEILARHPAFKAIRTIDDLKIFMSWHVFAVWDFMSLIKRLQQEYTSTQLPWTPPRHPLAARLINEIVCDEESDEMPNGGYMSHFEIYLLAMREVGASTNKIEKYIELITQGSPVESALEKVSVPSHVKSFVTKTIDTVIHGSTYEVLGSFFFGREHVIPNMFRGLLLDWGVNAEECPMFVYYLNRHIDLDGDSHGPAARKLIENITQNNPEALAQVKSSALASIQARNELWDGLDKSLSLKLSA